jgi:3-isopropylmalate/(R)-2-methylmalate dehydratase small subunit
MIRGKAHKYGDNVDTDVIIPARYLNTSNHFELAANCMEDIDKEFITKVRPNDIIVGGKNFGCGSSREHAPIAIKTSGISAVVARSFARIFYRNAINIGLPIIECEKAAAESDGGDEFEINLKTGEIKNITKGKSYRGEKFPDFMMELFLAGGLVNYAKERLN